MGALKSKFRRSKSRSDKPNDEKVKGSKKQSKRKAVNLPESQSARRTVDPRLPFSNYRQIFSIRNAWKAIQRAMEECAKETFVSFLDKNPRYRGAFNDVKDLKDGDLELVRFQEDFEQRALCMYNIFDDVITNLEEVNKALETISYDAEPSGLTAKMIKAYEEPFIETIKMHLGSDRFTEATENNFKLLYQFVQDEMFKFVPDDTGEPDEPEVEVANDETKEQEENDIPHADEDVDAEVHVEADNAENNISHSNDVTKAEVVSDAQIEVNLCAENGT